MARSSLIEFARTLGVLALAMICIHAQAEINLERLARCDQVQQLRTRLASPSICRRASTDLEKAIVEKGDLKTIRVCILAETPSPLVEGFSCARVDYEGNISMSCWRRALVQDIERYKAKYVEEFAPRANEYKTRVAACSYTDGNAMDAQSSLFPALLSTVAKQQFAVAARVGRSETAGISHGYAIVDPSVAGNAAIEYVDYTSNIRPRASTAVRQRVGKWILDVDDSEESDRNFNTEFKRRRVPISIDSVYFNLSIDSLSAEVAHSARVAQLESVMKAVADTMRSEGLKEVVDDVLQEKAGMSKAEIIQQVRTNIPFGRKDVPLEVNGNFYVFINEQRPSCTGRGEGAIGIYVSGINPLRLVQVDYGSLAIYVVAMGRCANRLNASEYAAGLIDEAKLSIGSALMR